MSADQAGINEDETREGIADLLKGADHEQVSLYKFRRDLAHQLGLGKKCLEDKATDVNRWIKEAVQAKVQRPKKLQLSVFRQCCASLAKKTMHGADPEHLGPHALVLRPGE